MKITLAMVAMLAMPPEQYDHEPVVPYSVAYIEPDRMSEFCPDVFGMTVVGCTVLNRYILIRNDLEPDAAALVLRHEKGHVNGWEH